MMSERDRMSDFTLYELIEDYLMKKQDCMDAFGFFCTNPKQGKNVPIWERINDIIANMDVGRIEYSKQFLPQLFLIAVCAPSRETVVDGIQYYHGHNITEEHVAAAMRSRMIEPDQTIVSGMTKWLNSLHATWFR